MRISYWISVVCSSDLDLARSEVGTILVGGTMPDEQPFDKGMFYMPTIVDGLSNASRSAQEEIFGPVLVAIPFEDESDIVAQANDTVFGLAAGMWTGDYTRAWRVAREKIGRAHV